MKNKTEDVKVQFVVDGKTIVHIVSQPRFKQYSKEVERRERLDGEKLSQRKRLAYLLDIQEHTKERDGDLILDAIRDKLQGTKLSLPLGKDGKSINFTLQRNKAVMLLKDEKDRYLAKVFSFWARGEKDSTTKKYSPYTDYRIVKSPEGYEVFSEVK